MGSPSVPMTPDMDTITMRKEETLSVLVTPLTHCSGTAPVQNNNVGVVVERRAMEIAKIQNAVRLLKGEAGIPKILVVKPSTPARAAEGASRSE